MDSLQEVGREIMRFMRSQYHLDEVGNGKNELKFRQGKKTILTLYLDDERLTFLLIFGKKERECFEANRQDFSQATQDRYDSSKTYHDGKWMTFSVNRADQLTDIKKLIQIKKRPNRKPLPKAGAIYGKCGHRCDLCIHFKGLSEEQRAKIQPYLTHFWEVDDWSMRCGGCPDRYRNDEPCFPQKCANERQLRSCRDCDEYPCANATVGFPRMDVHTRVYSAEEITWALLPYVPYEVDTF